MREHYLYKYVCNNEIIYIGKTNSSLKQRIKAHEKEDKFQPYIEKCNIYIMKLANSTEVNTLESLLINKYSPILNVIDKHENVTSFHIEEPEWYPYESIQYLESIERIKKIIVKIINKLTIYHCKYNMLIKKKDILLEKEKFVLNPLLFNRKNKIEYEFLNKQIEYYKEKIKSLSDQRDYYDNVIKVLTS